MRKSLVFLGLLLTAAAAGCTAHPKTATTKAVSNDSQRPVWMQTLAMVTAKSGWAVAWSGDPNSTTAVYQRLLRTSNGGKTWKDVTPAGAGKLLHSLYSSTVLHVFSPRTAWLAVTREASASENGLARTQVFETGDAGRTWRASAVLRAKGYPVAISVAGRRDGWLLQSLGAASGQNPAAIYRSTDGGLHWRLLTSALPADCDKTGLTFATPVIGFISSACSGGAGTVLSSDDGGSTWLPASLPYPVIACASSGCQSKAPVFFGRTGYLTVGSYPGPGFLLTTNDTGSTWRTLTLPPGSDPYPRIDFFDARHGVLMPSRSQSEFDRTFYATSNGGRTWRPLRQAKTVSRFSSIEFVTPETAFAWDLNATSPALYQTVNGGATWERFVPVS